MNACQKLNHSTLIHRNKAEQETVILILNKHKAMYVHEKRAVYCQRCQYQICIGHADLQEILLVHGQAESIFSKVIDAITVAFNIPPTQWNKEARQNTPITNAVDSTDSTHDGKPHEQLNNGEMFVG